MRPPRVGYCAILKRRELLDARTIAWIVRPEPEPATPMAPEDCSASHTAVRAKAADRSFAWKNAPEVATRAAPSDELQQRSVWNSAPGSGLVLDDRFTAATFLRGCATGWGKRSPGNMGGELRLGRAAASRPSGAIVIDGKRGHSEPCQ